MGAALVIAFLLSGCGSQGYGSTQDVADALDCQPTGNPEAHSDGGYTVQTCTFQGDRLAIYWMDDDSASWSGMPWAKDELFGTGRWNIECGSHAECVKVQRIVGGVFGRRTPKG